MKTRAQLHPTTSRLGPNVLTEAIFRSIAWALYGWPLEQHTESVIAVWCVYGQIIP
jgi:hypothetical protein